MYVSPRCFLLISADREPFFHPVHFRGDGGYPCFCVQFLHKLTARALIRDFEDGSLDSNEAEHEVRLCVTIQRAG